MEIEPKVEKLSPGVLVSGRGKLYRDGKEVQPTYAPYNGRKSWYIVLPGNYEYEFLNGKRMKLLFLKEILKESQGGSKHGEELQKRMGEAETKVQKNQEGI